MTDCTRRQFLRCGTAALALASAGRALGAGGPAADIRGRIFRGDAPAAPWKWSCEAQRHRRTPDGRIACGICPNRCLLAPGDRSVCRSRVNIDGTLYSLAYGNPCAVHVDPVEKKPLFHFNPGSRVFSVAATGCNFRCLNCQNWEISQAKPHEVRHQELFPNEAVAAARQAGCPAIAYTYSEPITFFEYMRATADLAHAEGIDNLMISNGYINTRPLRDLCRLIDGANINLKSFDDAVYRRLNGGRLAPVLSTLKTLHAEKVHLEITHLVVPGYVDDETMLARMCDWILENLGPDHPLHFLRFFPHYKLDRLAPTPVSTLTRFREIALRAGLHYAYVGNVPGHEGRHTYCHACGRLLIERRGYHLPAYNLDGPRCRFCGTVIPGVWPPA